MIAPPYIPTPDAGAVLSDGSKSMAEEGMSNTHEMIKSVYPHKINKRKTLLTMIFSKFQLLPLVTAQSVIIQ